MIEADHVIVLEMSEVLPDNAAAPLVWDRRPRHGMRRISRSQGPNGFRSARQAFRLTVLCHVGDCQEMECDAICFNVCIAMALLIFAPAKSPQRDVQL